MKQPPQPILLQHLTTIFTTITTIITTRTSTNHTPILGPLRGTRWMFPPATLPLEVVAFWALTLVAPQQRCAILKLSLFWGAGSGGVSWLQAAPTSLVSPYRYIHRCTYGYNASTVGKVTGGFWNPPVTNRIHASIAISIVISIVISYISTHDRTVAILAQVLLTSFLSAFL